MSSFMAEKRGSDDKKSSVKSSSREKQSEDTNTESKESDTKNEVNGTSEDIKSEGDTQQKAYAEIKLASIKLKEINHTVLNSVVNFKVFPRNDVDGLNK